MNIGTEANAIEVALNNLLSFHYPKIKCVSCLAFSNGGGIKYRWWLEGHLLSQQGQGETFIGAKLALDMSVDKQQDTLDKIAIKKSQQSKLGEEILALEAQL